MTHAGMTLEEEAIWIARCPREATILACMKYWIDDLEVLLKGPVA